MSKYQVTTIDQVLQVMTKVYMRYAQSLTRQGKDATGCEYVAKQLCYHTQETYSHMSELEKKVNKALNTSMNQISFFESRLADGPDRWASDELAVHQVIYPLLQQSREVLTDWFNNNEPEPEDFLAIGMPEIEGQVDCQQSAPPAGVTRSIHEEADSSGPMFNR
jgi:hypothetical protein